MNSLRIINLNFKNTNYQVLIFLHYFDHKLILFYFQLMNFKKYFNLNFTNFNIHNNIIFNFINLNFIKC